MSIHQAPAQAHSIPVSPYKVDTSAGSLDGSVSRQWMSRPRDQKFDGLLSLRDAKKLEFDNSWDHVVPSKKGFEIVAPEVKDRDDLHKLDIVVPKVFKAGASVAEDVLVAPSHHTFGQLCSLVKAPPKYLRTLPSQFVAQNLNYGFRALRTVEDVKLFGDDEKLMAATSANYGRIPDHEVVEALINIAGNGLGQDGFHWKTPGKLNWSNGTYDPENIGGVEDRTFYGSDRDLFVFLVDDRRPICVGTTKDGAPDLMFRGFYLQNSMVGARSLAIKSFYLRGVCMNRNLWGCEGFEEIRINHTRMAPDRWLHQCVPALEAFSAGSDVKLIEAVAKAKEAKVAKDQDDLLDFMKDKGFTKSQADRIIAIHDVEEGKPIRSVWDFAQGVTAFARDQINADDRLEIEHVAKRVLDKVA